MGPGEGLSDLSPHPPAPSPLPRWGRGEGEVAAGDRGRGERSAPPYHPAEAYVFAALLGAGVARWDGQAWEMVNAGLSGDALKVHQIAVDPFNPTTLLIATEGGVYRTRDALDACTWSPLLLTYTVSIEAHPDIAGTFYAGTANTGGAYFFRTGDYGQTWSRTKLTGSGNHAVYDRAEDICLGRVGGEQIGDLPAGEGTSWQVAGRVGAETPHGETLVNTVVAHSPLAEHDPANNSATARTTALHSLRAAPEEAFLGVAAGGSSALVVTVRNGGAAALHDVAVALPGEMPWLSAFPPALGELGPGGVVSFTLTAAPPTTTLPGYSQGYVTVQSREGARAELALTAFVWDGPTGTVVFSVTDEVTRVAGAEVTLISPTASLLFQGQSGPDGTITFAGIPAGSYNYQVSAPGHVVHWGQCQVEESPAQVQVALWSDYVSFDWWAEDTDLDDDYDILLTITYRLADRPILVPCAPWHGFSMPGGGEGYRGPLPLNNPSSFTLREVTASAAGIAGITLTLGNDGYLGTIPGGTAAVLNFTATGHVSDNYPAGDLLLRGVYTGGDGLEHPFSSTVHLLVNPTAPLTCTCLLDGQYYRTSCRQRDVPGDPRSGPPAPPYWPGGPPVIPTPYSRGRLRLSQGAGLTRQAFWANLRMESGMDPLYDIHVTLTILDEAGLDVTDRFVIDDSQAREDYLPPAGTRTWRWLLVPRACAGGQEPAGEQYFVSAQVSFEVHPRLPPWLPFSFATGQAGLVVKPEPRVFLYYYLPRDFSAGEPFQVQIVAQNWGWGPARDLRMTTPAVWALDGQGRPLHLQVLDGDLLFGDVGAFQQETGYVDLLPDADGTIESIQAGLYHRDYRGLLLDPLLLSVTTYLVYCDHVEVAGRAGLPDPGPECSPGPPPEPHLLWVAGPAEQAAAFPGEWVTHAYTVYNLNVSEAVTVALQASSEHGWTTVVSATAPVPAGGSARVPVRLLVPEDAAYDSNDLLTLQATYVLDPRAHDEAVASTRVVPLRLRLEVRPGTDLQVNGDGWYTPNPITYCAYITAAEAAPVNVLFVVSYPVVSGRGSFLVAIPQETSGHDWRCELDGGGGGHCEEQFLDWQLSTRMQTICWPIWVQPMITTSLAGWIGIPWEDDPTRLIFAETPQVEVPRASIHPVIVVPGFLGTFPPEPLGLIPPGLDPWYHTYDPLFDYLEALGYEREVSLFGFPYNWMSSVPVTSGLLKDKIDAVGNMAGTRTYVDYARVDLVTHSMGGLVARAYLEGPAYEGDVRKVITLATPHRGTPGAYLTWEGNDTEWIRVPGLAGLLRAYAIAKDYCRWGTLPPPFPPIRYPYCTAGDLHDFIEHEVPAVRDTLPTADVPVPYLLDPGGVVPYPYGRPENVFLEDLNRSDDPIGTYDPGRLLDDGLTIWAVYSLKSPEDTILQIRVRDCFTPTDPLCDSATAPLWLNGIEVERVHGKSDLSCRDDPNCNGDSVVPGYSARIDTIPELAGLAETVRREDFLHANIPKESAVMEWLVWVLTGVAPPGPGKWPGICARWPEVCR